MGVIGFHIQIAEELITLTDNKILVLEEVKDYCLNSELCYCNSTVFWGEKQLISHSEGVWTFSTGHWIGDNKITIHTSDKTFTIPVQVKPRKEKLSNDLWCEILQDLEAWLPGVTVGIEGGRQGGVSSSGTPAAFIAEALIPLLPVFYDAIRRLIENLRQIDTLEWEEVPLRMMRRVDRQTLKWVSRHPDVAVALDPWKSIGISPPWVPRQHSEDSIDHPANRYVAWLIAQIERTLTVTADSLLAAGKSSTSTEDSIEWCNSRATALLNGATTLHNILLTSPLTHIQKQPATEASFQVVIDDPMYARVHKIGRLFLNPLFKFNDNEAAYQAAVRPSFTIYELWCFFAVFRQLKALLNNWSWTFSKLTRLLEIGDSGDGVVVSASSASGEISVLFNPTFRSYFTRGSNKRWSISGERRPDIVITYKPLGHEDAKSSWLCLDAKYRVGKSNLSDAFESVHIYKDSLRYEGYGGKCCSCLLLSPSRTEGTKEWFSEGYINQHQVGVWELRPGSQDTLLAQWICREFLISY